jgi:hypothetical protein
LKDAPERKTLLATLKSNSSKVDTLQKETEYKVAEKSSWDQANRGRETWRKKISSIINDYLILPFFFLIILWQKLSPVQ